MNVSPYQDVVAKLQELRTAGAPIEQAASVAESMGWTLDELRAAKSSKGGGGVSNVIAPAIQGATLGFGDEITAGLRRGAGALGVPERFGGAQDYGQALGEERAILKRARSENPKTAAAVEFGGALVPGLLTAGAATGPTMASTLLRSAGVGAAQGGAYGAGSGETLEERGLGALGGAAVGGVTGAALPLAVEGVRAGLRAGTSAAMPRTAALGELRRAVARDAMTPAQLAQQAEDLAAARPGQTTLMDAGGENVRGLAERVSQTPGAGRTAIVPRLEARQQGQRIRLADDLKAVTGTSKKAFEAIDDAVAAREAAATPLYTQAYAARLNPADEQSIAQKFQQVINTPYGRTVWGEAQRALASHPDFRGQDPTQLPLTIQVDFWQRIANDKGREAFRGGASTKAGSYFDMAKAVVKPLDQANPAFGQARAAYSGPSAYMDAVDQGRDILSDKVPADQFAAMFAKLSPAEQEGFRVGAVSTIIGKMENAKARVPDFTRDLNSQAVKDKLATIMPTPEAAEKWARAFAAESRFSDVAHRALSNSRTPRLTEEMKQAQAGEQVVQALSDVVQGGPLAALWGAARRGGTAARDSWRSRADEQLAQALQTQGVPAQNAMSQAMGSPLYTPTPSRLGPALGGPAGIAAIDVLTPDGRRRDPTMPY